MTLQICTDHSKSTGFDEGAIHKEIEQKRKLITSIFVIFKNDEIINRASGATYQQEKEFQQFEFFKNYIITLRGPLNSVQKCDMMLTHIGYFLGYMKDDQIMRLKRILKEKNINSLDLIKNIKEFKRLQVKHQLGNFPSEHNSNVSIVADEIFDKGEYRRAINVARLARRDNEQAKVLTKIMKKFLEIKQPDLAKEAVLAIDSSLFHLNLLKEIEEWKKAECSVDVG